MFDEPSLGTRFNRSEKGGWIEVICGSMFSGKTEELIRRLRRAQIAHQNVEIFKPSVDTRYHNEEVVSHNANSIPSTPVPQSLEILALSGSCDVVGIDEVQFFNEDIVHVCNELAASGKRVICAGLDMDFKGKPFGVMPLLMAHAEFVTKVHAVCVQCGGLANFSFRLVDSEEKVLLGESNTYEARCRKCFNEGIEQQKEKGVLNISRSNLKN